jgi:hypothetical protein
VLLFLAMLVHHDYTNDVYFSFLIVGHTHEDIDQLFSTLSRWIKNVGRVMTPAQFATELKEAMKKRPVVFQQVESVLDWDSYLRPSLVSPVPVGIQRAAFDDDTLVPHTFWIHKREDGTVVLHYKEFAADEVWLPSRVAGADPLVTDPAGIEIFNPACPPPDPATKTPTQASF